MERRRYMYQVLIWGIGTNYQKLINLIKYYEKQKWFEVIGVTSDDKFYTTLDGYPFIPKKDLKWNFDYIIATPKDFHSVMAEVEILGGDTKKLIAGKVLQIPDFNFAQYIKLRANVPSIISRDCYAAVLYNVLGIPFLSPTILLWFDDDNYLRLLSDLQFYMQQTVEYVRDEVDENSGVVYPVGKIADVEINFNHYSSFEEAKTKWEQRVKRIKWDRLFVVNATKQVDVAKRFMNLSYERKMCFTNFEMKNCINLGKIMKSTNLDLWGVARKSCKGNYRLYNPIEILL